MNGTEELLDTFEKVDLALANVAAVRDAVGPNVGIGVDFHGRVHKPMAKVLMKDSMAVLPSGELLLSQPESPQVLRQAFRPTSINITTSDLGIDPIHVGLIFSAFGCISVLALIGAPSYVLLVGKVERIKL